MLAKKLQPSTATAQLLLCDPQIDVATLLDAAFSCAGSFTPDPEQQPLLQTVVLDVGGMKCGGCSAAVKSMLLKHPGVQGAAVNLLTESAAVTVR
jgi:Cu2+-exporting ATPase